MDKKWLMTVLGISFFLLAVLKAQEIKSLKTFVKTFPSIKLKNFEAAKSGRPVHQRDLLELWESILTGRTAPVASWMKERYKLLGLNHLFSPSGFHLSAVLLPFMKFIKSVKLQLCFISLIGVGLYFLPGLGALKRMVMVKGGQKVFGQKQGFILALLLDVLFGSFQDSALSFSYSFLFLGIIYSGVKGLGLIIWFFLAQVLLAYFQGLFISPAILLLSPLLNAGFGFAMPFLFILSLPLSDWQVECGLFILSSLQSAVDASVTVIALIPSLEIHSGILVLLIFFLRRNWRSVLVTLLLLSSSLNLDLSKAPSVATNEFVPRGKLVNEVSNEVEMQIYFTDGNCKLRLVRGFWWEKCSPRRRSRRAARKFSYPS
ncbi:MAG TPA: hypothetical protein VNJ01_04360 [Bacteriovoracaceae bacterium]|nr:hypothetical protein [Bacteriovoracaceae bacterium]